MKKTFSVVLEEKEVDQLKESLVVGQKFSPVVNELIKLHNLENERKKIGDKHVKRKV